MGAIVFIVLISWLIAQVIKQAKLDYTYARQGLVSPRLQAKYGDNAAGLVAKYGLLDFVRDAWRDYWPRRTQALIAARDARAAGGTRPSLRSRIAAGRNAVTDWLTNRRPAAPPPPEPLPVAPATPRNEEPTVVEPLHAEGVDQPPVPPPVPVPPSSPEPSTRPAPAGGSMPATGEATNLESALATIDEMITDVQEQIAAATAALVELADAKAAVDALQQAYQPVAAAAETLLDHETARNLDATTLAHSGAVVEALPVGAVDNLYDGVEAMETIVRARLQQAEAALAALLAQREHLIATYTDAYTTVAEHLSGNPEFVGSE
jgi:hypothetical protein